ncbi:MAG: cytochrome c1 [Alphaproteobacteria bacterium]|nr:MAG: cytochrome c1 [Alphaproteobacteria bacterium]
MKKILSALVLAAVLTAAPGFAVAAREKADAAARRAPVAGKEAAAPSTAANTAAHEQKAAAASEGGACPEAEKEVHPPKQFWPHKGLFGVYDMASVQRGFQVYREVCASCHAMKYLSYRDLGALGYNPEQVKAVAASVTVTDGPNDEGQMFERPGRPSDPFKSPFPNDKAARFANNGALPPDMSLLVKAREHGEDYIAALLTGYSDAPACASMNPGMNWNKYFPTHQIAMPKPLNDGQVQYTDGTPNNTQQEARDVAQFLAWASEPHLNQRKEMGLKIVLFMLVFAGIMAAAKCRVWEGVK